MSEKGLKIIITSIIIILILLIPVFYFKDAYEKANDFAMANVHITEEDMELLRNINDLILSDDNYVTDTGFIKSKNPKIFEKILPEGAEFVDAATVEEGNASFIEYRLNNINVKILSNESISFNQKILDYNVWHIIRIMKFNINNEDYSTKYYVPFVDKPIIDSK